MVDAKDFLRLDLPPGFNERKYTDNESQHSGLSLKNDIENGDVEVILIQAPLGINVENLHEQKIPMDGRSHFKCEGPACSYETFYQKDVPSELGTSLLLIPDAESNQLKPTSAKLSGYLTLVESVSLHDIHYPPVIKTMVPFPVGLKQRYVPFGAEEPLITSPMRRKKCQKERRHALERSSESSRKHRVVNGDAVDLHHLSDSQDPRTLDREIQLETFKEKKKKKKKKTRGEHGDSLKRHREDSSELESTSYTVLKSSHEMDVGENSKKKKKLKKNK